MSRFADRITHRIKRAGHLAVLVGIAVLVAGASSAEDEAAAAGQSEAAPSASAGAAPAASEEQALRERVEAYWQARVAHSPKTLDFYPHDENGQIVGGSHVEGGSLEYTSYEVEKIVIDGDRGMVMLEVKTRLTGEQGARIPERYHQYLNQPLSEEWTKIEGSWYKKPVEQTGLSRFMRQKHEAIKAERAATAAAESAKAAEAAKAANAADAAPAPDPKTE